MKIKMKTLMAGPEDIVQPEQEIELENEEALQLVKGGYAIPLEELKTNEDKTEYPKHIAGGLYLLSNGEKVKGKEAAHEAENALKEQNQEGVE